MASEPVILSDPRVLAEFMRQSEFQSFFEKRFAVPPDYAALLFKNGELIDAFKGGHFSVGGIVDRLKSVVGGSTHVSMMIADLKPFMVQALVKAKSKDHLDITGVVTLELQVNPDKPSNILGFMHGVTRMPADPEMPGRKALTKAEVLARIEPHLADRVFENTIGRMNGDEIRGNAGLQDKLQADVMQEVERIVGELGIMVRNCSMIWASNAQEETDQARADALRKQDDLDFQIELAKRDAERTLDATEFSIKTNLDIAKLENASEDELRRMALDSEITFIDARETAKRRQEFEELQHQIEFLEKERKATFENALANARHKTDVMQIEQHQKKIDLEMDKLRQLQLQEMRKSNAFNEIEITAETQKVQREHISGLQEIELRADKVRAELKRIERQGEADHELNKMKLQAGMTPEQILAIQAGMSPAAAQVLSDQARAKASSNEEAHTIVQKVLERNDAKDLRTAEQIQEMFRMGMQGAVGVAQGAGGGAVSGDIDTALSAAGDAASSQMIDCPKCSTSVSSTARFCVKCGHKLRT